ncbi:hypothetical protein ABIB95_004934 [Bradyrhizobium sp. LA2.1]
MSITAKIFAGSVPEVYDTYLGPLIFESYAADLAARVSSADHFRDAAAVGVIEQ